MTANLPPLPDLGPSWTPHWTKVVHDQMQAYARAAIEKDRERQSVPAFDSVRLTRFLTDVVTAAGLLSHGKQSKAVAERVAKEACAIRSMLAAAPQPQPVQQPVAWTDEQMIQFGWMLLCQVNQDDSLEKRLETFRKIMVARNTPHPIKQGPVQQEPVVWLPIETAPKDSSMLRLLVNFDDHSLEDCSEPCWTIGTNALSDTGEDEWLFAGWDWTHDRFTQGTGTPIGWLPMLYTSPQAEQPLKPDMFWNSDDADEPHDSIECFLNDQICQHDLEVGAVFTIWQAKKLPSVTIRVTAIDEEECEAEYEAIEKAHGITKGTT